MANQRGLIGFLAVLSLVVASCGDDAGGTDVTIATTTTTRATTLTTAATTTTVTLSPAEVLAEYEVPVPEGAELVFVEPQGGADVSVGANVAAAPPPDYPSRLAGTDWEVLDVIYGSESTVALQTLRGLCLLVSANTAATTSYWLYFYVWFNLASRAGCLEAATEIIELVRSFGAP